ncbi:hypothetical protein ZIOFF_000213 [Zingiber officinale]|uniref:Amino acid transporter transmembrane domain-containing protein n=1 Tax=Zingiber officinale TaxID=94328 RepID=A0A8J5LUB3_ZINOF|nr:hypothetical protein ZIOFF_000213 [Zingiber officinale]
MLLVCVKPKLIASVLQRERSILLKIAPFASNAGGAGAADAAVLVLAAGDAVGGDLAAVLRAPRKLDGVPHQRPLHRVPHPQGKGKRQLQESRYPGGKRPLLPFRPLYCSLLRSDPSSPVLWFEVLDGLLGSYWKAVGLAFNCTFLLFGSVIQLIACASNIYYINDRLDKRTWTYIFGACCATTVFIPSFHNYRIWSFLGLGMTTYTAWYLAIAAIVHGQADGVTHSSPTKLVLYFTGATNILYTFGGHAVTVEIMHAMWKPQKFKYIYLLATLYVFTLTLPSAAAVYWAFGDELLNHSNAFSLLPKSRWRDAAVILMLIHQFITFGFACTPLYFVWEKVIGMHDTKSMCVRAVARLPVVVPIWFLAIIFPFFGPINSAVGALLVSFTVYIIPAVAHILTYRTPAARQVHPCSVSARHFVEHLVNSPTYLQNAAEKPPYFLPSWTAMFIVDAFIVGWVLVVGFGLGGWASMTNFVRQVDTFGLFAKCYQCPKPLPSPAAGPSAQPSRH